MLAVRAVPSEEFVRLGDGGAVVVPVGLDFGCGPALTTEAFSDPLGLRRLLRRFRFSLARYPPVFG